MKTTFRRFFDNLNGTLDESVYIKHITRAHRWFMLRATRRGISGLIFRTRSRTNTMTRRKKAQVMRTIRQRKGSQRGKGLMMVITACKIVPVFRRAIDTMQAAPSSPPSSLPSRICMSPRISFAVARPSVKSNRRLRIRLYARFSSLWMSTPQTEKKDSE